MSFPGIAEGFIDQGELEPDNLISGEFPRVTRVVSVTGGVELPAGSVLGRVTATGQYRLSEAAASDGSQVPNCILSESVDTVTADVLAHAYFAGEFNAIGLNFGTGHTVETVEPVLRLRSILLRKNQP